MPDITMCTGDKCNLKDTCYRFTAIPNEYRQAYFITPPVKNNECNKYLEYCNKCHQYNGVHKMSCSTQKQQINL